MKRGYEEGLEDGRTKSYARRVADHYSARTNQTLEEREASPIIHLKKLNNWIKSVLIQLYARRGDAILDLACGKGGDLIKWDKAQIGYYVGIDIAQGSIEDCRTRYNGNADQAIRRKRFTFPARLICGDCYEARLDKALKDDGPFDICSCQFALHYSWSTEARARRALANVSSLLRPGGTFIGTMPDANVIIRRLREAKGLTFGNRIYQISFDEEYAQEKFKPSRPFGIKYQFHLEDAVDCPEWIVPFHIFKSLAEEYDLELVFVKNFHEFVDENLKKLVFSELMRRLGALGDGNQDHTTLSKEEWEVAYLYLAFVLRKMSVSDTMLPHIALLGAGIFVRMQYIPRLRELVDYVVVKTIWSRTEESARAATELARGFSPNVDCKWGEAGLDDIIQDRSIHGVAIVLAGQVQVDVALRMLKAGKHVIQEKPAAESTSEAETALSDYSLLLNNSPHKPIWALAENYRFEPAFVESRKLMTNIGEMMNIQVIVEGSMNSSNPYFSSSWRRKLHGGFIVDMGVHFIAGLRMVAGCDISTVSAVTRHVDTSLPPPDNICALFQLENGCPGVFVMTVSSPSPKIHWRFVGSKGTLQVERGNINGRHGYSVLFYSPDGNCQSSFYPFSGVTDELKTFFHDISRTIAKDVGDCYEAEPRSSFVEGARDVAVLEAMLESSKKEGALVRVKAF